MTITLNIKVNYIVALYSMAVQNVNIIIQCTYKIPELLR